MRYYATGKAREDGFLWKDDKEVYENLPSTLHLEIIKKPSTTYFLQQWNAIEGAIQAHSQRTQDDRAANLHYLCWRRVQEGRTALVCNTVHLGHFTPDLPYILQHLMMQKNVVTVGPQIRWAYLHLLYVYQRIFKKSNHNSLCILT